MKDLTGPKIFIAAIGGFFIDCVGGWDNQLALLVSLITADILSGLIKGIRNKSLSSKVMREGLFKKAMIIVIIAVAVRMDELICATFGHPLMFDNHELYFRTAFCLWFMLEELISLCENCDAIGVPLPKWLRGLLSQINDSINETTPTQIMDSIKKWTGKDKKDILNKEEGSATDTVPSEEKENNEKTIDK